MAKTFFLKIKESLLSVLPITAIITVINFSIRPMPTENLVSFFIGAAFLIVGMGMYSLGTNVAIEPIGSYIGSKVSQTKKIVFILVVAVVIGFIVTIAEPDLSVLATQVSINKWTLILTISAGVGIFMILAVLRIIFKIPLNLLLIFLYLLLFILVIFADKGFLPLAFDAGGVTTGPVTVPFIMSLCIGISTVLGGTKSQENSFGMVGICSVGPVIAILILSLVVGSGSTATIPEPTTYTGAQSVLRDFGISLTTSFRDVGIALAPITAFFLIMQFSLIKLPAKRVLRLMIGILYSYVGLSLFLTGASVGFMSAGVYIGSIVANDYRWLLIPLSAVIGACIVLAEPAIHVLNAQVEEITGGMIKRKTMIFIMMVSMATALSLSLVRVLTKISILWFVAPGYVLSLALSFFVPKIFTGIAFDSGGVASGPMTTTFVLPFAMGACVAVGGDVLSDAFGVIALVAMTPLITLQILGLTYKIRTTINEKETIKKEVVKLLAAEGEIISLDWSTEENNG